MSNIDLTFHVDEGVSASEARREAALFVKQFLREWCASATQESSLSIADVRVSSWFLVRWIVHVIASIRTGENDTGIQDHPAPRGERRVRPRHVLYLVESGFESGVCVSRIAIGGLDYENHVTRSGHASALF